MKLVFGVGINGVRRTAENKPFYSVWKHMLGRCYSNDVLLNQPTYKGCTVCDDWLTYSNFKRWMVDQDWKGKYLDKDILEVGNKVYHPDKCIFVDRALNNLLSLGKGFSLRGSGKYRATINTNGRFDLGQYDTEEEARRVYLVAKSQYVLSVSDEQSDLRIRAGLIRHACSILNQ